MQDECITLHFYWSCHQFTIKSVTKIYITWIDGKKRHVVVWYNRLINNNKWLLLIIRLFRNFFVSSTDFNSTKDLKEVFVSIWRKVSNEKWIVGWLGTKTLSCSFYFSIENLYLQSHLNLKRWYVIWTRTKRAIELVYVFVPFGYFIWLLLVSEYKTRSCSKSWT